MKQCRMFALVGLVTVFFILSMAFAQGQSGQSSPRMGCQQRFDSMDTNHDGKLTKEEFMATPHHRGNAEQIFTAMDVNGQGFLTKDQFCSGKGMGKGQGQGQRTRTSQ